MLKKLTLALALLLTPAYAMAASLLPNGEQVFLDNNGDPISLGKVYFYVPSTTTPKDTWQDPDQATLNTNPVVLDAAGRAVIYGSGDYRQIVKDADDNTIWDQLTADPAGAASISWGGTSTGSANAQVIATSGFSGEDGQQVCFIAGFTNTGPMTLQPSSSSAIPVRRDEPAGPLQLAGGEVVLGNAVCAIYDNGLGAFHLIENPQYSIGIESTLASDTTTSLGTIPSHNVNITGTTTITSFGSAASTSYPLYYLKFADALLLTYNGTSLILPGGYSITTAAGDTAIAMYLGSGNWKVIQYTRAAAPPGQATIAGGYRNLVVTGTADTTATITADAITVETAAGQAYRVNSVSVTCTITTAGLNGLDTGSEASDTWYSMWVVYAPSTGVAGCLMSASATAPTLPSTYDAKVRVGWVRNNASSNLWRTTQRGNRASVQIGTNPSVSPIAVSGTGGTYSVTSPTLASVDLSSFVPSTSSYVYITAYRNWTNAGSSRLLIAPTTAWGGTNRGPEGSAGNLWPIFENLIDASLSISLSLYTIAIAWASDGAGGAIAVTGWIDNL